MCLSNALPNCQIFGSQLRQHKAFYRLRHQHNHYKPPLTRFSVDPMTCSRLNQNGMSNFLQYPNLQMLSLEDFDLKKEAHNLRYGQQDYECPASNFSRIVQYCLALAH